MNTPEHTLESMLAERHNRVLQQGEVLRQLRTAHDAALARESDLAMENLTLWIEVADLREKLRAAGLEA